MASTLKTKVDEVKRLVDQLYEWYVPPFTISRVVVPYDRIKSIVKELGDKYNLRGWFPLDGTYYTTDRDTFKKVVEWDWSDTRKYIVDTFDCDKFAMYFKARIAIDFGINAIGVILDYSAGHAYNLVILYENGRYNYYLYEPQNDNIFTIDMRDRDLYKMEFWYLIM